MIIHTRSKYSILLIIPLILLILLPEVSLADASRIYKKNSKAVVVVTAYDEKGNTIGKGSGFIVRRDGAVVTNYHVIGMARDIKVKVGNKALDVEGLIFTDEKNDLVILKAEVKNLSILKAKTKNMPVVKLGVIGKANIGEHVYVIGYPSGIESAISVGLLSGLRKIDEKREILKMSAPVSPGSSGSPVFNRNGEVIGIVTSSHISETRNSSFAISVKLIKDKISNKSVTAIKESGLEDYINTAIYWNHLGGTSIKSGMYKVAIEAYKQAIRIDPDYAEGYNNLGIAYISSGMYKEAIASSRQAIKIDPDYADAHNNLGVAYGKSGIYKEAIEAYKQAIWIDPDYAKAHYNLGVVYNNSGKYKKSIKSYKHAVRIDPDFAKAHYNLGLAYIILRDKSSALKQHKILKKLDTKMAKKLLGMIYTELD